jgi:N-acetyl-anhydromuramyl-L-alanine amidase AmpD
MNRTVAFVRAKFSAKRTKPVKWIVLHSMEAAATTSAAEALGRYFARLTGRVASAHYGVDLDSTVQYVEDDRIAYHAAGLNAESIGIEQAGTAHFSAADWAAVSDMIDNQTVPLVAYLADRYGIPYRFVDASAINAGVSGITTHAEVSRAKRKSTHWDPGPNYPTHYVIMKAAELRKAVPTPAVVPPDQTAQVLKFIAAVLDDIRRRPVRRGEKSPRVSVVQTILRNKFGYPIKVDGVFGPQTENFVKWFQGSHGLVVDGVVGAKTVDALAR